MKYTLQQYRQLIQPMIATALDDPRDKTLVITQVTSAIVELIRQDREVPQTVRSDHDVAAA